MIKTYQVLNRKDGIIIFNSNFLLLLVEISLILKKQNGKRDVLITYKSNLVKIIFTLAAKVVVFYIQTFMIQIGIPNFKDFFLGIKICLAMFLFFNK